MRSGQMPVRAAVDAPRPLSPTADTDGLARKAGVGHRDATLRRNKRHAS